MKRKSFRKGWKPVAVSLPDGIRPGDLEKMAERVRRILANGRIPSDPESAILKQVELLCLRTEAARVGADLNPLNTALSAHDHILHRMGFREIKHIVPLNIWITRRVVLQKEGIGDLLRQVEQKMRGVKEE